MISELGTEESDPVLNLTCFDIEMLYNTIITLLTVPIWRTTNSLVTGTGTRSHGF